MMFFFFNKCLNNEQEAFDVVGIRLEDLEHAFELLSAILWLGNISFTVIDEDEYVEVVADEGL